MPADREPAVPDPVIVPAFAASKPLIASAHDANLPRAVLDAVEEPCLSTRKALRYLSRALLSAAPVDCSRRRPSVRNPANTSSSRPSFVPQRRPRINLHRAARGRVTGYG